jgi:hypothetical protein
LRVLWASFNLSPMRNVPFVIAALAVAGFLACSSDDPPANPAEPNQADGATHPNTPDPDGGTLPDGAQRPTYKHYDINHVLSTGQSDSVANGASPHLTKTQDFDNKSFDVGVGTARNGPGRACDGDGCKQYEEPKDFAPLVEGDRFLAIPDEPQGFQVETMSSGLANQAHVFATDYFAKVGLPAVSHDILVSLHGRSGNTYACLRKGFCDYLPGYLSPFAEGLMQVKSAKKIAEAKGKTYVVRAVTTIHGGSDHENREKELMALDRNDGQGKLGSYADALMEWQRDYEADVRAITGQTEPIPLFVSQFASYTDTVVSRIPVRQLEAHVKAPGKVIVVTPNYPFVHYEDCNHYTNYSQRRLGAYFAKAYQKTVIEGVPFEPVRPLNVARSANVITVKYHVPVPPLVFDTERVVDPGDFGFTYDDSTSSATITKVELANSRPDTVTITLSKAPTGADKKLRYALNVIPNASCPGPTDGARGNLRDSDTTVGYHKDENDKPYELHNWAVHAEMDVP